MEQVAQVLRRKVRQVEELERAVVARQFEDECAADRREHRLPEVRDRVEGGGDLDREEDAADGGAEGRGDARRARRRQHLPPQRVVPLETPEGAPLHQQLRDAARHVDIRPLLANGQAAGEGEDEGDGLGDERAQREVVVDLHARQHALHLRDAGAGRRRPDQLDRGRGEGAADERGAGPRQVGGEEVACLVRVVDLLCAHQIDRLVDRRCHDRARYAEQQQQGQLLRSLHRRAVPCSDTMGEQDQRMARAHEEADAAATVSC